MDARLSILATAQLIVLAASGVAAADNSAKRTALARQLFELGIDEYKAKQFDAAVASMAKSYALDPQPEALYALAQSERLAGNCKDATTHYQKVLDTAKDDSTKTAVKASLQLCTDIEKGAPAKPEPADAKAVEQRDAPTIEIRTVYRTERRDRLAIALFATGGVAIAGGVTTYLLARSTRSDADHAQSLAEYNSLFDRATTLRWTSYIAGGVGIGLIGYATYRAIWGGKDTHPSDVAIVPISGGSMVSWASQW